MVSLVVKFGVNVGPLVREQVAQVVSIGITKTLSSLLFSPWHTYS